MNDSIRGRGRTGTRARGRAFGAAPAADGPRSSSGAPKRARRSVAFCSVVLAATALGCGGSAKTAARAQHAKPLSTDERVAVEEAREQKDAQRVWCKYLEALYLRAAEGAKNWPRYQQCTEVTTMASPTMLKRTAECSMQALSMFKGDPFTAEYAAEVSRCGSEALDSIVVTETDLAPFVAAICGRASTCGSIEYGECRESLESGLGPHLERAIGAINRRGRAQLRACFKAASCDELPTQITACLEPIMDSLLWLPG